MSKEVKNKIAPEAKITETLKDVQCSHCEREIRCLLRKRKLRCAWLEYIVLPDLLALIAADRKHLVEALSENEELLEVGRKAIEDELIKWRDERLSMFNRGNGLVVREKDGKDSSIIRFGPETALKIGLKAIAKTLIDKALEGVK